MSGKYPTPTMDQLKDESGLRGNAEGILNPTTEAEAAEMIKNNKDVPITFQGTRTGICGGSVPDGGIMLGTAFLKWLGEPVEDGEDILLPVGAGVTLDQLEKPLRKNYCGYVWPPHPTEETATVGGICVLGSKGLNACHYGDTRQYIAGVHLIDKDGQLLDITDPAELDKIVGSEGSMGLVTQVTIRLVPAPEATWGVALFFDDENSAAGCAEEMMGLFDSNPDVYLTANEFLDRGSLDVIDDFRNVSDVLQSVPDFPEGTQAMLYVEISGKASQMMPSLMPIIQCSAKYGSDPDTSWAQNSEQGVAQLHAVRHAVSEGINAKISRKHTDDERIVKLGLDLARSGDNFSQILAKYRKDLHTIGITSAVFGHVYNNNLHVNLIPDNAEEYEKGENLMRKWVQEGIEDGAQVFSEHGLGRLKKRLLD